MIKHNFGDNVVIFQSDNFKSPEEMAAFKNYIERGFETGYIILDASWKITVLNKNTFYLRDGKDLKENAGL